MRLGRRMRTARVRRQRGITLVELAVILPIAAIVLLVVIEGVWAYAQHTNVRNSAEEGARLAAANFGTPAQIGAQVCDTLDVEFRASKPRVVLTPGDGAGIDGDVAEITVRRSLSTLTGIFEGLFLDAGVSSTVEFTLKRPASGSAQWWNGGAPTTYRCS